MTCAYLHTGECLSFLRRMPDNSVDLVVTSPPYEGKYRDYGIGYALWGNEWVEAIYTIFMECVRVSRGMVAFVVDGCTIPSKKYGVPKSWSAAPERLAVRLADAGVLWPPCYYFRYGTPGSRKQYFRRLTETILVGSKNPTENPPWSNTLAEGTPPKYKPGGNYSNRKKNGERNNAVQKEVPVVNPGNVINCGAVGGGNMGHPLAHKNEAPYPIQVPRRFILSFCPENGFVLDPFSGSGTSGHMAIVHNRNYIGIDLRDSQTNIAAERLRSVHKKIRITEGGPDRLTRMLMCRQEVFRAVDETP